MTVRKSVTVMSNTGTNWSVVSDPVRGAAYYGYGKGIHTVQVTYQNFVGGFGIQGTLATDPRPEDWFWIKLNPFGDNNTPYLTFPQDPYRPTGQNGGDTGSQAVTFIGNFVYIRAVLTREYLLAQPLPNATWDGWQHGQIDRVLLSI